MLGNPHKKVRAVIYIVNLYWNGQLVWTPAVGLYLCVFLCVDPCHVELRNYVISRQTLLNIELRNYVIPRQNFIK